MHPLEEGKILLYAEIQPHILVKKSYSPHMIPKTKGLDESLGHMRQLLKKGQKPR